MADDIQLQIDRDSGRLILQTPRGPARLAVIDSKGNVIEADNIEGRITDAVIDAVFAEISHKPTARH